MTIPFLDLIPSLRKPNSRKLPERPPLRLAGINQKVFLNQWGEPETQFGLNRLGKLDKLGTLFLLTNDIEETPLSVWIYKKKESVLLFTKEKLISHSSFKKFVHESRLSMSHSNPIQNMDAMNVASHS